MLGRLEKISKFIQRTGEKAIVFDQETEYVIIPLNDYYRLLNSQVDYGSLNEEDLLKKINREVAMWREARQSDNDWADSNLKKFDRLPMTQSAFVTPTVKEKERRTQSAIARARDYWEMNPVQTDRSEYFDNEDSVDRADSEYFENDYYQPDNKNMDHDSDQSPQSFDGAENESDYYDDELLSDQGKSILLNDSLVDNSRPANQTVQSASVDSAAQKTSPIIRKINNFGYPNPSNNGYLPPIDIGKRAKNRAKTSKNDLETDIIIDEQIPPPPSI